MEYFSLFSNKLISFFITEEYEMDHLQTIFDNFVLGGNIAATPENPCKLAVVNSNNNDCNIVVKTEPLL